MDDLLRALLKPSCMTFEMARWPCGHWHIGNVSRGHADVYQEMAWVDTHHADLQRRERYLLSSGACATAFAILKPTFEEIEEVNLRARAL